MRSSRLTTSAIGAQQYERETRYAAEDYAEQVFTHLEENLKSLTGTVTRCRQQLNEGAAQQEWSVVMAEFPSVTVDLSEQLVSWRFVSADR